MAESCNLGVRDRTVYFPVLAKVPFRNKLERIFEDLWIMQNSPVMRRGILSLGSLGNPDY
jgi:hypothetical protein